MGTSRGSSPTNFLVDFENAFKFAIERFAVDVGEVEVDHGLTVEAEPILIDHLVNGARWPRRGARGCRTWGTTLQEKSPAVGLGNLLDGPLVARDAGNPDPAPLAAGRLRHEAEFVFTGDAGGVNLDELAVGIVGALLKQGRLGGAVQATELVLLPKRAPLPPVAMMMASAEKERSSMERRSRAVMPRATPLESSTAERNSHPSYFFDLAVGLIAANLFVERVEKLLAGGGAGESGAMVERAAEAPEIEQALGGAVEGHAHAVEQVDNGRRRLAHGLDRR